MGEWEETAPKLWVGEGKSAELPREVFPSSSFEGRSRTQKPPSSLSAFSGGGVFTFN